MTERNPKVDAFLHEAGLWAEEMGTLRTVVCESALTEELKWGVPCYTHQGRNVVLIHGFKEYCAILFVKGALLKDPARILVRQSDNVQAARQIRFSDVREITAVKAVLKAYLEEAIEIENAGLKVSPKAPDASDYPQEFVTVLAENADLKEAFEALTPGRRRAYGLFFSAPKQAKTREARIAQSIPKILAGKGLYD